MVCVPVYQLAPMFRKTQVLKSGMIVRGGSSTSNLIEPHHYKDSKVCRVLSHEFGVVNNCMAEHCLACSRR